MILPFIGIAVTSIKKLLNHEPVREGISAFIISGIGGFIMLLLSSYQYIAGKKQRILRYYVKASIPETIFLHLCLYASESRHHSSPTRPVKTGCIIRMP